MSEVVYRIAAPRYAQRLTASGVANRWNLAGQQVLYTAASAALACLENVVHRGAEGLRVPFALMVIELAESLLVEEITPAMLPPDWQQVTSYPRCQRFGDAWYRQRRSAVLRVPSAVIPSDFNYLLNTTHPDFSQVALLRTEEFRFDPRIKDGLV